MPAQIEPHRPPAASDLLTPREREILALLAEGQSDGEIARRLFISPKTASVHVANIKAKLGATTRVQLALLARDRLAACGPAAR